MSEGGRALGGLNRNHEIILEQLQFTVTHQIVEVHRLHSESLNLTVNNRHHRLGRSALHIVECDGRHLEKAVISKNIKFSL